MRPFIIAKYIGKTFGTYKVLEFSHKENKNVFFIGQCTLCKMVVTVNRDSLRRPPKGCGNHTDLDSKELKRKFNYYRANARLHNREFVLTLSDLKKLIYSDCVNCGSPPLKISKSTKNNKPSNGIDRIDSSKGYSLKNCQTYCLACNMAKSDSSLQQFKTWVENLVRHKLKTEPETYFGEQEHDKYDY